MDGSAIWDAVIFDLSVMPFGIWSRQKDITPPKTRVSTAADFR